MRISKIAIVGLGLIGGSLAKSIKTHYPYASILIYNRSDEPRRQAFRDGLISSPDNPSLEDIGSCDAIFLCLPVAVNAAFIDELIPYLKEDSILTDVGSVKADIMKVVSERGLLGRFIGGHPMAGSEKSGYAASSGTLLDKAAYILTIDELVPKDMTESFSRFIEGLGARPIIMDPIIHDKAVAAISHLPHVLSFSYAAAIADMDQSEVLSAITAGSYRDMTRIALSDPTMWKEIFISNRDEILKTMDLFEEEFAKLRGLIEASDFDAIHEYIENVGEYQNLNFVRKKR